MKKFCAIVMAFAVVAMVFSAQDAKADQQWQAGLKAGATAASLGGDQVGLYFSVPYKFEIMGAIGDSKIGFTGGGYVRRAFSDMFAIQLEALYSQRGGEGNVTGTIVPPAENTIQEDGTFEGVASISLDYFEVPVLAMFTFPADDAGNVKLFALGGGTFGYVVRNEINLTGRVEFPQPSGTSVVEDIDQTYSISSQVNSFDFGIVFGGGIEAKAGGVQLVFDARYTIGLTNVNAEGDDSVRNNVVAMYAGVGIPFGSEMEE